MKPRVVPLQVVTTTLNRVLRGKLSVARNNVDIKKILLSYPMLIPEELHVMSSRHITATSASFSKIFTIFRAPLRLFRAYARERWVDLHRIEKRFNNIVQTNAAISNKDIFVNYQHQINPNVCNSRAAGKVENNLELH